MKNALISAAVLCFATAAFADDKPMAGAPGSDDMAMMQKMMTPEMMQMHADEMMKMSEMHKMVGEAMAMNAKGMKDKAMKDHMMAMSKEHMAMSASAKKMHDEMMKGMTMKMPADMKMDPKAMDMMKQAMTMRHDLAMSMQKEDAMMQGGTAK